MYFALYILQDTSGKLKEIADFLGRPIDDARSKQIAEAVNFKSLKAYMSKQIYETDIVKAPGYMKAMYRKGTYHSIYLRYPANERHSWWDIDKHTWCIFLL